MNVAIARIRALFAHLRHVFAEHAGDIDVRGAEIELKVLAPVSAICGGRPLAIARASNSVLRESGRAR